MKRRALTAKDNSRVPQVATRGRTNSKNAVNHNSNRLRSEDKENEIGRLAAKSSTDQKQTSTKKSVLGDRSNKAREALQKLTLLGKSNENDSSVSLDSTKTDASVKNEAKPARKRNRSSSKKSTDPPTKIAAIDKDQNKKLELNATENNGTSVNAKRRSLRIKERNSSESQCSDNEKTIVDDNLEKTVCEKPDFVAVKSEPDVSDDSSSEKSTILLDRDEKLPVESDDSVITLKQPVVDTEPSSQIVNVKSEKLSVDGISSLDLNSEDSVISSAHLDTSCSLRSLGDSCSSLASSQSSVDSKSQGDESEVDKIVGEIDTLLEKIRENKSRSVADLDKVEEKEKKILEFAATQSCTDLSILNSDGSEAKSSSETESVENTAISSLPCPKLTLFLKFDKSNILEPHMNPAYMHDIFVYLTGKEDHYALADYMPKQPYITTKMRTILIDWFIEVQENLALNHETIYLAVKICDQYLMRKQILKSNYQLLGLVALFIACKYDDRCPPRIFEFLSLCGSNYFELDMIRLELDVLRRLKFDIGFPLSYRFLRRFSNVQNNSFTVLSQARFILECSLLEYTFFSVPDSLLAAASLMLAHLMLGSGHWCEQVEYASGYKRADLTETMRMLNDNVTVLTSLYRAQKKKFNVVRKYTSPLFKNVASTKLIDSESITDDDDVF